MNTILFILLCYGLSNIIVYGSIFNNPRSFLVKISPNFLGKLFTCMMCFPVWSGFFFSITFFSPTLYYGLNDLNIFNWFTIDKEYLSIFFDGILGGGTTWLIHTLQEMCERAFINEDDL